MKMKATFSFSVNVFNTSLNVKALSVCTIFFYSKLVTTWNNGMVSSWSVKLH